MTILLNHFKTLLFVTLCSLFFFFTGCQKAARGPMEIKSQGTLRVLTLNSPTTYYEDREGEYVGFEHDLAKLYGAFLGVEVEFIVVDTVEELFEDLRLGKADLVAAGISKTKARSEEFLFSPAYQDVSLEVVCRRGLRPKAVKDLIDKKLLVADGTSYIEILSELKVEYPKLKWEEIEGPSTSYILKKLRNKEADCSMFDSHIVSLHRRYYPRLETPFSLKEDQSLAWVLSKDNLELQKSLKKWFEDHLSSGRLESLKQKYFGFTDQFDPYDIEKFKERIQKRLPKYKDLFQQASKELGWPWTLLAAISYQESHWNPKAKSPTGVRGLMMLTRNTAGSVGVENRLDPKQSVMGGARYLKRLQNRLPSFIPKGERRWMTLAAYNVGYAHLRDAWGVAAWRELNTHRWSSIRQVLPLLSKKSIYKRLPHGYARGGEPVIYIDRIKNYYDILKRELTEE